MNKPTEVEVIPAESEELQQLGIVTSGEESLVKMGRWQQARATLAETGNRVEALCATARTIEITDSDSRLRAGATNNQLKDEAKIAEATVTPFEKPLGRVLDFLRQTRQRITNRAKEGRGVVEMKMANWDRAEEQRTAAEKKREQDRIDAENKRIADENARKAKEAAEVLAKQKIAQAKKDKAAGIIGAREYARILKEAGAAEEAAKAEADAKAEEMAKNPPKVEIKPNISKAAGERRLVKWHCECAAPEQFLMKFINAYKTDKELFLRMRDAVVIDVSRLNAKANEQIKKTPQDTERPMTVQNFEAAYPFVKVREDRSY